MWNKKIIKSNKIIKRNIVPAQVTEWSYTDFQYRNWLIVATQANPELLSNKNTNDDFYKKIIG